jgi:hypothetical protein
VLAECRLRFGIESTYRELSDSRIRTSTRDPRLRVLYVAASLLLVNAWVEKKWTSSRRRGEDREDVMYTRSCCPIPVPGDAPVHLERKYESILAVEVPEERSNAGSVGR